jgi:Potential Queuosine, Q, salvage protein family
VVVAIWNSLAVRDVLTDLRAACAAVAENARYVRIDPDQTSAYTGTLPVDLDPSEPDPESHLTDGTREELAAFWLTLDAINFGSGWFPTLRKRDGRSGYFTIAAGIRDRFAARGPYTAGELAELSPDAVAATLGQEPDHELMALFALSLNDLGGRIAKEHDGRFAAVIDAAESSAVALVNELRSWDCFGDTSCYYGLDVPFLKRAQIAAADLARAGVAAFRDLDRLTMFADNLVPHVLRIDGLLSYDPGLLERIERGELIEHGSPEEVEIRACALHAVGLLASERAGAREADIDSVLWHRGQEPRYKDSPRHRSRCTAY